MKASTEVALVESEDLQETKPAYTGQTFDLTSSVTNLPDLSLAAEMPLDLSSEYWTPEKVGESKRVFFDKIDVTQVLSTFDDSAELIDLECAFFLEQTGTGEVKSIRNASKLLVGALLSNSVKRGTALMITYIGEKKNRKNSYKSASWSIKPLIINI